MQRYGALKFSHFSGTSCIMATTRVHLVLNSWSVGMHVVTLSTVDGGTNPATHENKGPLLENLVTL